MIEDWNIEAEIRLLRGAEYRMRVRGFEAAPVGVVLGSGLKDYGRTLHDRREISFNEFPEFPRPRVPGHGGTLVQGRVGEVLVHCLTGRVHLYEGYHPWEVVRAVRALALLGTRTFILTNAAGGIRDDLGPGSLMAIEDHINLTGVNVLRGDHHESLGPRFPSMTGVYDPELRAKLCALEPKLTAGVYAQMPGPSYETPAEVRMLRTLGADAVGMSTVPEAVALHAMGCRVVGISLITNRAAGLGERSPSHEEVIAEGRKAGKRLHTLLTRAITAFAAAKPPRSTRGTRAR